MIFSSLQYLLFLPLVTILYWRTRGTTRLWLVVAASYFFYMSWLPIYGVLLFVMTCVNWALGLGIDKARRAGSAWMKPLMVAGLVANLWVPLSYYKYTNFFLSNICGGVKLVWSALQSSRRSSPQLDDDERDNAAGHLILRL